MILGVDRLDYTKGLVARLMALEVLFSQYPQWIGKVTFLQVAVPSRIDVKVRILKKGHKNGTNIQRCTCRVLQTIQMKLILSCVWAEWAILGRAKTGLKLKYEI